MVTKLREVKILRPLFALRDFIWEKTGMFDLKKRIKRKLYFRRAAKEDDKRRKAIADKIMQLPNDLLSPKEGINIVASMTSYGKRVEHFAPYALYTVFMQKTRPNRIVLNIDESKWNEDNIPNLLKCLVNCGLEINFVHDVGPHTKLLPTLSKYPDDIIITFDDDVYYDDLAIDELYNRYIESDSKSILCREGKLFQHAQGKWKKYSEFPDLKPGMSGRCLPYGVAGVLYPPNIFSDEIFNESVFRKLCPLADDVWFAVMELRDNISTIYVYPNSWDFRNVIDNNEEYNPLSSGALYMQNDLLSKNDEQMSALLEYYNL